MKLTRLSPEDFDRIADGTKLRNRARDMARAVLVDGRTQVDVAAQYGMTKQRVYLAVQVMQRAYSQDAESGGGWIRVNLNLPESLALELTGLIESLENCTDENAK